MAASAASLNIVNSYYKAILRITPPASLAQVFAAQLDAGSITAVQLESQLLSSAQSTTFPALLTYDIFYNTTPGSSGLDFLTAYSADLQAGNYQYSPNGTLTLGTTPGQFNSLAFSLQNTYVNLAASFAGDPKSSFKATYGSLSATAFITQIYSQIFGVAPAAQTVTYLLGSLPFYTSYAGSTLGAYGAIAGVLLSVAVQSGVGQYPAAANAFLGAAAVSLANGGVDTAHYGTELIAGYGSPNSSIALLTTGTDNVTGSVVAADLTPFIYNGIGPTLNVGDHITGSAGLTSNTFDINDQFGTGTDVIPAGVAISNMQTIDLTTQGNAGGSSPLSQLAGVPAANPLGTTSGVFDTTTSISSQASNISGVNTVNVISAGALTDNLRTDPGALNPVSVTVNHQHVNGTGGVFSLGGNNVTVTDGDGTAANAAVLNAILTPLIVPLFGAAGLPGAPGLAAGLLGALNAGVTIGSPTVVNTNDIDLNPTGKVTVTEIGNNQIIVNGGSTVAITASGGGAVLVGSPTNNQLSYPSDEPIGAVTVNDNANVQAGPIFVFSSAPVTNTGTVPPTMNATTATITETSLLAGAVDIGAVTATGGILSSFSPAGNDTVSVSPSIPVNFNFISGGPQTGLGPIGLTPIVVIGGATDTVTTDANSVFVGSNQLNGLTPVLNENATGNVTVTDTAVIGGGQVGAGVTVVGGQNVTIANAGGAVTVGAVTPLGTSVIVPSGTIAVTDTSPVLYDNVINTGSKRDVAILGGTTVTATTNAGAVSVGLPIALPGAGGGAGSEPTGPVTVTDTASPGGNDTTPRKVVVAGSILTVIPPGIGGSPAFTLTIAGVTYTVFTAVGDTSSSIAQKLAAAASGDPNAFVTATGATVTVAAKVLGALPVALGGTLGDSVTAVAPVPSPVPVSVFGGTNVIANSANGPILVGAGATSNNPSGNVTATTNGIETGGQFASPTTVMGGVNVVIATTGASGTVPPVPLGSPNAVTASVQAGSINFATGVGTPITGTVSITDTFAGTQNADSFAVWGGVGIASAGTAAATPAVSIITTATSGNITVGNVAPATLLNSSGTGLANPADFANGNVVIVNEDPAGTGVAGTKNVWGTGGTEIVNVAGPLATNVSIAGGGFATVTDEETTLATGGPGAGKAIGASSLATVVLDHVGGAQITTDALANLSVLDDPGTVGVPDTFTVTDAQAHALALTIGNDGTGTAKGVTTTIIDPTATTVTVGDNGKASTGTVPLTFGAATSITFNTTAALNTSLAGDGKLTSVILNNTGTAASIALGDLSGIPAVTVTAGAGSTGKVSATLNGLSSFAGGGSTGTDTITLTSNTVTGTIQGGGGTGNTIIANYAASAADTPLGTSGKVLGFSTLGVGKNAVSSANQQTVTVGVPGSAITGAPGDTFTVTMNNGTGGTTYSFTYTEVAGDSSAAIAAALAAGLAGKAAGDRSVVVKYVAGSTSFNVVGASAVIPPSPVVTTATSGAGVIGHVAGATLNNYDATSFSALTVGVTAGPVGFSNVGANETLSIAAALNTAVPPVLVQPNAVTLTPAGLTNTLNLNIGAPDGPATNPPVFTNATVATSNTQTINVTSTGQGGSTKNTLALTDAALKTLTFAGDESITVTDPSVAAVAVPPGITASAVSVINASATTNSTNAGSVNTVDTTGVAAAITGVTVTGGAGVIKAIGVQGLDTQNDFVTLTGIPGVGDTVTVTITTTSLAGVKTPHTVTYTVVAGDITAGNNLATEQAVAAKLAALVNTAAIGVTATSNGNFPYGVLSLAATQTISAISETTSQTVAASKAAFTHTAGTVATPQVDTVTLTGPFVTGDVVSEMINFVTISYTVVAGDTNATIATGLAAKIAASSVAGAVTAAAAANVVTLTATTNGVTGFADTPLINIGADQTAPASFGVVGAANQYTAATDIYTSGAGGGTFTLGSGGGFNPYAVNAVTSGVITTRFLGVYDSGYEQVNLTASPTSVDTLMVNRNVISTFNGVNGGVTGFQDTASTKADAVLLTDLHGYTAIANIGTTKFDFTNPNLANAVAALDPSGKLANNLANASYSVVNGVITIVGAGNNAGVDDPTKLAGAELVVAQAAAAAGSQGVLAGTGIAGLVTSSAGNTYVVSAALNDNLYNSFTAVPAANPAATPPVLVAGTPNSNDPGVSVVELVGLNAVNGFGSSVTAPGGGGSGGITSGLGAQGAVLANVQNVLAPHPDGTYGNAGKNSSYDDGGGYSLDQLTTAAGVGFTTSFAGLAPASQLNIKAGGQVGNISVTQSGASGTNSLIVDLQAAATIGTLTLNGDALARLVADATGAVIGNFTDANNLITTVQATGTGSLMIGSINDTSVTTVDASGMTDKGTPPARGSFALGVTPNVAGVLAATPVNINNLVIKGALGDIGVGPVANNTADLIFANGAANTITIGSQVPGNPNVITGNVYITAAGNGDTVTLGNEGVGTTNFLTVGGSKDVISVDNGTNNIAGGFQLIPGTIFPVLPPGTKPLVSLQNNDTINLSDGGVDNVWVGTNSTVNLTGNSVTVTPVFNTTAGSVANIQVTGDTAGTTSAGFAPGGTGALTTITGVDTAIGTPVSLTFLNAGPVGVGNEVLAGVPNGAGNASGAFVNVQGAASLAAALDIDVNQSLILDAQTQPGSDTTVAAGVVNLNANTGIISWFQFSGNTYLVDATNATAAAAPHAGLQAGDTVVKLAGLVNLSGATLGAGVGPLSNGILSNV